MRAHTCAAYLHAGGQMHTHTHMHAWIHTERITHVDLHKHVHLCRNCAGERTYVWHSFFLYLVMPISQPLPIRRSIPTYIYIYIYIYLFIYDISCVHTKLHLQTYEHLHICVSRQAFTTCIHTYMCTYIHTYTHIYIYIYIYTYMYICTRFYKQVLYTDEKRIHAPGGFICMCVSM